MCNVVLAGCAAEPLGSYLKALGVLRLVAEQEDAGARGWWEHGQFCLESRLDGNGLVEFFERRYRPTPILAPWNGGSGFYAKDRKVGVEAIVRSEDERLAAYRTAVGIARAIPQVVAGKGDAKTEEARRTAIQVECRNEMPDEAVDWLDAAIGISAEGDRFFPPILGTGGNDGRLDYTNNFMEHVANLLLNPGKEARGLLRNALFSEAAEGFEPGPVGQYEPGRAGGFNQSQGVESPDVPMNPWSFVLTLEGAVAWAAGMYRRQGVAYRSFLCSPFTVRSTPVGYGSAAGEDKGVSRAEIWAPIWTRPAQYRELKALLREGRATVNGRPAQNGLEFAEAATMLGVDRGIAGFVRYNLLMRRGKSYIALPAGQFAVNEGRRIADLIRELHALLENADAQVKEAPPWYDSARRQIDAAMFECLARGEATELTDTAAVVGRWLRLLLGWNRTVRLAKLPGEWVTALGDVAEVRIAGAIASMWHPGLAAFREHLAGSSRRFTWTGCDLAERMAVTLERRVIAAESEAVAEKALRSGRLARNADAIAFLEGSIDDELMEDLLFALTLVDWRKAPAGARAPRDAMFVWPVYGLLKHMFLGRPVPETEGVVIAPDLNVIAALRSGDVARAAELAARRMRIAGLAPPDLEYAGGFDGTRLAAALLIPVPYSREFRNLVKTGD